MQVALAGMIQYVDSDRHSNSDRTLINDVIKIVLILLATFSMLIVTVQAR